MFSEKIRNNLYNELNTLLDNNEFYNINTSYNKAINDGNNIDQKSSITENDKTINKDEINYKSAVKGISFSNKIDSSPNKSNSNLLEGETKIYKISELLSANYNEMITIPYDVPKSLALVPKFTWKDALFSDVPTAFSMIKNKFKN